MIINFEFYSYRLNVNTGLSSNNNFYSIKLTLKMTCFLLIKCAELWLSGLELEYPEDVINYFMRWYVEIEQPMMVMLINYHESDHRIIGLYSLVDNCYIPIEIPLITKENEMIDIIQHHNRFSAIVKQFKTTLPQICTKMPNDIIKIDQVTQKGIDLTHYNIFSLDLTYIFDYYKTIRRINDKEWTVSNYIENTMKSSISLIGKINYIFMRSCIETRKNLLTY